MRSDPFYCVGAHGLPLWSPVMSYMGPVLASYLPTCFLFISNAIMRLKSNNTIYICITRVVGNRSSSVFIYDIVIDLCVYGYLKIVPAVSLNLFKTNSRNRSNFFTGHNRKFHSSRLIFEFTHMLSWIKRLW